MSDSNTTDFINPSTCILIGIPGLQTAHRWISIPFSVMFVIAVLGNFIILFIVKREPSLHGPIFYFLCMLPITDLVMSTSTVPKMLRNFWFNSREIRFGACLTHIYFLLSFSGMESGIHMAMAFDCYMAICHPLRYSTILTNSVVAKIGLAVVLRSSILSLPYPLLARQFPYCRTNIIPRSHCGHMSVVSLACADISISSYYSLFDLFAQIGMDVFFITVSYAYIIRAIFRLPTKDAHLKTFGTCISHLCAILSFYFADFFSSLIYLFGQYVPRHFLILIGSVYPLVPPVLHPVIYGVRTKQIWVRLLQLFMHKGL